MSISSSSSSWTKKRMGWDGTCGCCHSLTHGHLSIAHVCFSIREKRQHSTKCSKGAPKVHSFVVTNFVCWISSCWMTKQATTTVQCNAMQPSTTCFSPNVWWSSCKLSSQVFDESNMLLLLAMAMIPYPTNFKLTLTNVFFLLYPYWPNATQTSPNECNPNISKGMPPKHPQKECHPNTSPKRIPPKYLPKTNATQTSRHWMLGLYYTTLLPLWWQK
jgi:hypothetical protein